MAPQRAGRDITKQMLRHRQTDLDQTDFKQKAEEKKMSMSKNIARLAVTAGLTAALSFGGVMAPVTMAFAEDGGRGSITISQVEGNKSTTFKAYQIFKATVTDADSGKIAQDITWASDTVGEKVIDAIKNDWKGYGSLAVKEKLPDDPTAQEVADFLMAHAGHTTAGSTSTDGTRIDTGNVLYAVANAVKSEHLAAASITAGETWTPDPVNGDGYYLFVTSNLDSSKPNTGTSPIFAILGGEAVTVTEKTSIPTVAKKVLDDSKVKDGAITEQTGWEDYADSQINQDVDYKLTGTIADNYGSYDSYFYKFTDTLSKGLSYDKEQTKVYAVKKDSSNKDLYTDITENFTVESASNADGTTALTIEVNAGTHGKYLKEISSIDANTTIVVFYKAKLNSAAVVGNNDGSVGGNPNTVKLEYSNNPFATGTGTSVEDTVADFTFKLNLNKVDQGTEKGLKGAVFTIQSNDSNTAGKYVASQDDTGEDVIAGQLVSVDNSNNLPSYVMFTSNDKGEIAASGLDAGSYKVHEVSAPSGSNGNYTPAADFTFTIKPTYNSEGTKVTQLQAVSDDANRKDIAIGNLDNITGDNQLNATDDLTANASAGAVTITVGNTKSVGLPLTGLNGVTFTWIAGGAVLCIGVAHLIRSRKQAEESEQE